jgi:small subunit ribosomal protein S16
MALKISLKQLGRKKQKMYRIVVREALVPRDGRYVEALGQYNPQQHPVLFDFNEDRVKYWLSVGAQPTETVARLLGNAGIMEKVQRTCKNSGVSRKELKAQAGA